MSTQTFSGYSGKKSSTRIHQRPGGNTSIDLFGGGATNTPPRQHQRRGSRTGNLSGNSPFNSQGAQQQQRNSRQVPANNPTYTPNNNSPFSKAPLPQKKVNPRVTAVSSNSPFGAADNNQPVKVRRSSSVNQASAQSPFNPQGAAPQQRQPRAYKANEPSQSNPFNANAPQQQQQPRRSSSQRFNPSQGNPLTQSQQPVTKSKSSVRLHQTPGGTQSVNLFGGAQQPKRQVRATATYQPSAQAPWNPNAAPVAQVQRKDIKANAMSQHNPLAPGYKPAGEEELRRQQQRRPQPKANVPDRNSPFSKQAPAPMKRRNSKNFHTSATNPLNASAQQVPKARNNAVKIQQTPGGRQSVNLFGQNSYA